MSPTFLCSLCFGGKKGFFDFHYCSWRFQHKTGLLSISNLSLIRRKQTNHAYKKLNSRSKLSFTRNCCCICRFALMQSAGTLPCFSTLCASLLRPLLIFLHPKEMNMLLRGTLYISANILRILIYEEVCCCQLHIARLLYLACDQEQKGRLKVCLLYKSRMASGRAKKDEQHVQLNPRPVGQIFSTVHADEHLEELFRIIYDLCALKFMLGLCCLFFCC